MAQPTDDERAEAILAETARLRARIEELMNELFELVQRSRKARSVPPQE